MFSLNDEQRQLSELIRRVAREKVAPRANAIDASAEYPQDMFDLLRELGLFTLPFPVEYGGSNSMLQSCIAVEEFGRVCYNTAYLLVVQWVPIGAIIAGGTKAQKDKYLPPLASGEMRGALSISEPQSGSDVARIKTKAVKVPGGYEISGAKIWCTNASKADIILVGAKSGDEKGAINLFIVPTSSKGLQIGRKEDKMGGRGVPSHPLFLDKVFVPDENRLGEEGRGFKVAMEMFNASRPIVGARGVGLAQGALDHALEFILGRQAFGQAVADFQGIRWMLADMHTQTEAARYLVYAAAAAVDEGQSGSQLASIASMSKLFATDVAMKVATDAVQIFGASGISSEYPIGRYFRDAKLLQIVEGTNQIQRNIISRILIEQARGKG
jgi:alkylation response protein AidB-like acyl-CoA dehydrogenase